MTGDAQIRRLLALLLDEQALETESSAEVRADLAALGLDPARALASVRRLAAGAASPAIMLLGQIAAAEDTDDEIRRLEQADIVAVRQGVPAGTTAAAVATAQRAAGRDANIVGLRPRRSRRLLYGLCGAAAALAASLVLVVGLSERHDLAVGHLQAPAEPASTVAGQPATGETDNLQAQMKPAANGPAQLAEQAPALPAAAPAPAPVSADAETSTRANSDADDAKKKSELASQPGTELADTPSQTAATATAGATGQAATEELRGEALANRIAQPFGLSQPISALLIVDPKLVPPELKQENYPTGNLPARLDDARRLAGALPVAALVTLQLADRAVDAVVIAGPPTRTLALRRDLDKTAAPAESLVSTSGDYDIIILDRR